jgi:acyl-coenzyme A synthetase/AMP-(fatty) acid ligase
MIVNHVYDWAARQPDRPAIIDHDRPISYAEFAGAIDAARGHLIGYDLPAGATAVVMIELHAEMWFVLLALRSLGLNTVCVQSLDQAEQLGIRNIAAVVTSPRDFARHEIVKRKAFGKPIILVPEHARQSPPAAPAPIDDPDRPYGGHILYTSGTTGVYKKVLTEGRHEEAQVQRCILHRRIEPESVVHMLSFAAWTGVGFKQPLAVWRAGATIVIDQRPDALNDFFRHAPSFTSLTVEQAQALVIRTATLRRPERMPIVNLIGGFVPLKLVASLRRARFDDVMINFGSTECSHVLRSYVEDDDRVTWLAPASDRRAEIADEDGKRCAVGQEGRLRIALLDHDCHGYLDDPETSARVFANGWFYPGDLAVERADGRIRILGRAGDVLNVKGQKMATAPLEQQVRDITRVENICLFQSVGLDGRDELVVVLEMDGLPAKPVIDRVAANFRGFDGVRVEAVGRFPRTTTGMEKINRLALRQMVLGESAGATPRST